MSFVRYFMLLAITGIPVFGNTDLIVVTGNAYHSPNLGVPPPLLSELIERAHQNAIDELGTAEAFHQVIAWSDAVKCEPVYRGSPNCYKGSVISTASFVPQKSIDDNWHIKTSAMEDWVDGASEWTRNYCKERARQKALKEARFFCGYDVVMPPSNVEEHERRVEDAIEPGHWDIVFTYSATFQCIKSPTARQ